MISSSAATFKHCLRVLSGLIKTHLSLLAERIWASVASPSADVWPQLFCIKGLHVRGNQLVIQFGCDLHCLRSVIFHVTPCCTRYFNVLVIFMKKRPQAVLQRTPPVRPSPAAPRCSPRISWRRCRSTMGSRARLACADREELAGLLGVPARHPDTGLRRCRLRGDLLR